MCCPMLHGRRTTLVDARGSGTRLGAAGSSPSSFAAARSVRVRVHAGWPTHGCPCGRPRRRLFSRRVFVGVLQRAPCERLHIAGGWVGQNNAPAAAQASVAAVPFSPPRTRRRRPALFTSASEHASPATPTIKKRTAARGTGLGGGTLRIDPDDESPSCTNDAYVSRRRRCGQRRTDCLATGRGGGTFLGAASSPSSCMRCAHV